MPRPGWRRHRELQNIPQGISNFQVIISSFGIPCSAVRYSFKQKCRYTLLPLIWRLIAFLLSYSMTNLNPAYLLREARSRASLSQRELAERAGTAQSVIARIELGKTIHQPQHSINFWPQPDLSCKLNWWCAP